MIKIDELTGVELAWAVAEAQGWRMVLASYWRGPGDGGSLDRIPVDGYRPDQDIAQAWKLLDGYIYAIDTYEFRAEQFGAPVGCYLRNDDGAWLAHGDTVEEAICRTWLKAKGWEEEDDGLH